MKHILLKAYAKINLALALKSKRSDGYHEIETIYQEIDFYDRIKLAQTERTIMICDNPRLPCDASNLCVRAANLLQREFNIPGILINLEKNIPMGAGLGGGSSDAAAVLKGGIILYDIKIEQRRLVKLAAELGSDVPFFIYGGNAYARGRGEIITPIRFQANYTILLITPKIEISTSWAYKNLKMTLTRKYNDYKFIGFKFHNLGVEGFRAEFFNDFESIVFAAHPMLGEIKDMLYAQGADYASLSGSGSSLFGVFASKAKAKRAFTFLRHEHDCRLVKPVPSQL